MLDGTILWLIPGLVLLALVGGIGYYAGTKLVEDRLRAAKEDAQQVIVQAQAEEKELVLQGTREAMKLRASAEEEARARRQDLSRQERRVVQKEENLERKVEGVERRERAIGNQEKEAENLRAQIELLKQKAIEEVERVSGLTRDEAKELLVSRVEEEAKDEANRRLRDWDIKLKDEADGRARDILIQSIQRITSEVVSDATVSVVPIPSDDLKGRIIGREGRNVRAFEHATGVDVIIDDTPDCVTLSCYDPVRREIARIALTKLVSDGRIHPSRIEDVAERAKLEVEETMLKEAEQAVFDAGVRSLHPELKKLLGRLKYRYSYGQNVLRHSVEVARLAGMIASELGADVEIVKKGALLHDLGKGLDHEYEGPHAMIGASFVEKYEKPEVALCVAKHHDDWLTNSLEGVIVQTADAISGGRPGARGEAMDHYIKRLQALESIANGFVGVEKSYAVQAGREVRVIVKPKEVDDLAAMRLARDVAKLIQESLEYPGQIKVTVVRETRAVEYAQ
ncbi:MAG: rny [Dehalococcoidia bacterium]|nr:rny [Dehalococcoidia bacterium]